MTLFVQHTQAAGFSLQSFRASLCKASLFEGRFIRNSTLDDYDESGDP
ncbi:hypothetical protein [Lyngbya confervoides]|uniref:Uncharacterized protein n=1 Tax=Lyngbya confervoides BDU141951 TaxID=1574623 RepID=A0ABD4T5U2_9CYAN|nr:hypothetical protein [Lyngbya confervoides]MCM1983622.1 hypothetical protein [Lyngbya confervoides BDU141951]